MEASLLKRPQMQMRLKSLTFYVIPAVRFLGGSRTTSRDENLGEAAASNATSGCRIVNAQGEHNPQ